MYCKYCGKKIPDSSAVCPWCGKSLKSRTAPAARTAETARTAVPFFLLMAILFGPTLLDLAVHILYIRIPMLVQILTAAAAALLLFFGIKRAKIDVTSYRYSDAAVLACLWLLVPWISRTAEVYFAGRFIGTLAVIAATLSHSVMGLLRLVYIWAALGILLMGLGRKGTWRPRIRHLLIAAGVMLLGTLLGIVFVTPISWIYGAWEEVSPYVEITCRVWSLFGWLWPAAVLLTFWRLGSSRIGPVSAALAFLAMALGEFPLLLVVVVVMGFGVVGLGMVAGLSPLFTLLITQIWSMCQPSAQR